ncbi:SAYSvFN domain-containing protein 1-like [Mya arenaria]|nr:SAYSvFN domain-containing protein 1-like [Mya arenaria]
MEEQLAEYRRSKKISQESLFSRVFKRTDSAKQKIQTSSETDPTPSIVSSQVPKRSHKESISANGPSSNSILASSYPSSRQEYILLGLKTLLWLLLWKYFISIEFGAVFFIISCSYLMYRNTGTGPRVSNKLSAYSVFNPNQERIDGTFTAEQFEKELRHGSQSVN